MKVYILTGEPFPNGMAATNRIRCYARAIKEGGLDCEVLIFRRTEIYGQKPKNTIGQGAFNGIAFRFIGGTPLRGSHVFVRQANDRLDIWRTKRYLKRNLQKGDVLFFYMDRSVELTLMYMKVAHGKGALCVRDLCELPYGTGAETKKSIRLREITFTKQFPKLDGIISISDSLLNLAKKYSSPTCEHIKVPILVDYNQYYLPDKSNSVETPYIFHAGTLYEQKDGILGMIEAFGEVTQILKTPIKFISTGDINKTHEYEKRQIEKMITRYHLENKLQFTGYISSDELKDYLSKASLVVINKYSTQQNDFCFSTKLGEYLAAAKPVIITNVGEAMNWLTNGLDSIIIEPGDKQALIQAIVHVFSNPIEAQKIGRNGRNTCLNSFDYRVWSYPIVEFLKHLDD
ncbi:MAG: glycosyltransferase [Bacteroidaceae bacterium]|nr:glycosyltransferase [Bacteroidaceae bacterium]